MSATVIKPIVMPFFIENPQRMIELTTELNWV
jgi:hypothetical protein